MRERCHHPDCPNEQAVMRDRHGRVYQSSLCAEHQPDVDPGELRFEREEAEEKEERR